jgi:hypothetical protein
MITTLGVEFTPMGTNIVCSVNSSLQKEGDASTGIPIGEAKQRIIDAKLWVPKGKTEKGVGKKDDLLPKKSLVKADFSDERIKVLAKRAAEIAAALGDTTARGRIGSLKMMSEGIDTFDKWWVEAEPVHKTRLLSDSKHHKMLTAEDHAAFAAAVPLCPFRGSVPTPTHEEDEEDEEPVPPKKRNGSPTTTT